MASSVRGRSLSALTSDLDAHFKFVYAQIRILSGMLGQRLQIFHCDKCTFDFLPLVIFE